MKKIEVERSKIEVRNRERKLVPKRSQNGTFWGPKRAPKWEQKMDQKKEAKKVCQKIFDTAMAHNRPLVSHSEPSPSRPPGDSAAPPERLK